MQLDPQEWATLSRLLDEALDVSFEARERWLETLPPAHATHKEKLRALLRHDVGTETRNFRDVFPKLMQGGPVFPVVTPGARVGPYIVEAEIGRGGMGVVWRARRSDGGIKRDVALKLLYASLCGYDLMERFESERDILAQLAHPNIARLYDAGCSAIGQPYLALEYVAGVPLTEYCDRHRLDVAQRLRLFQQVLRAVQYAHGHLVIHRDLKPTNVLVGEDGRAMLLDFGIAKLVGSEAAEKASAQTQLAPLTPDYASPEQIARQPLTTASDIYSLGVLLFELLTGQRPYRLEHGSRSALEEAILNIDPRRPSQSIEDNATVHARSTTAKALSRTLRGDLDTIVLQALKKTPTERYATADALLHDVEQYLRGEPVTARADSGLYRARKLISRYKLPVAAGGAAVAALLATAAIALSQARVAEGGRDRALALSSRSEAVAEFLELLIAEAGSAGRPVSVSEMLARSETLANSQFRDRPEHRAAVLGMLGSYYHTNGKDLRAEPLLREALEALSGSADDDLRRRITCSHALVTGVLGKSKEAAQVLSAVAADPRTSAPQAARCLESLAYLTQNGGDAADALKFGKLALEKLRQEPHSPIDEATLLGGMGYAESLNGDNTAAEQFYARSLALFARSGHEAGPEAISVRNNWAGVSDGAGNPRRALALHDETLRLFAQNDAAATPPPYLVGNRAHALEGIGRYEEARRGYLQCRSQALQESTLSQLYCLTGAASASIQLGELPAADAYVREAAALLISFAADSVRVIALRGVRARIALKKGRLAEARAELDVPLDRTGDPYLTAHLLLIRAELNLLDDALADAEADARRALTFAQTAQGAFSYSNRTGIAWLMLGRVLARQGHAQDAREAFLSAITNLSNTVDADHPMLQMARELAGQTTVASLAGR